MSDKCDVQGKPINKGDTVVFGADNGSKLSVGTVTRVTEKRVFIAVAEEVLGETFYSNWARYHDRVCVVK